MAIRVEHLTKKFGAQKAVNDVTFQVGKGEIMGFLGPNGAGKSTTMKMLTGFLKPDAGKIDVCGFDPLDDELKAKQCIGYLPEHNPLYLDLYVREYLSIVAQIHGIRGARARIQEVIDMVGLQREAHKKIGALSKGYRQRIGLAQAMIHDPEVLILDEPTSGLDPNQLAEIRQLIIALGQSKTIVLSTHIMQEVQAICSRVLIIDQGKMVLDKPIAYLDTAVSGQQVVMVEFDRRILTNSLLEIPGITGVEEVGDRVYRVTGPDSGGDLRPAIFRYAVNKSVVILEMQRRKSSVEEVFQLSTRRSK